MQELTSETSHQELFSSKDILTSKSEMDEEEEHLPYYYDWLIEDKRRCKRINKIFPSKWQKKCFKEAIRQGIGEKQRNQVYLFLSQLDTRLNDFRQQWNNIVSNNSTPIDGDIVTLFGSPDYEFAAPKEPFKNFLTLFANHMHANTFSPMIPGVASILIISFQLDEAYFVLQSMYEQGNKYFTKNKRDFSIMLNTIDHIMSNFPRIYNKAKDLKIDFQKVALFLIPLFFSKRTDKRVSYTIFDSFVHDGCSIFIRYVVGIIVYLQQTLLKATTATEFMNAITNYLASLNSPSQLNNLIHATFAQKYAKSKKIIEHLQQQQEKIAAVSDDQIDSTITSPLPKIENFAAYHYVKLNGNKSTNQKVTLTRMIPSWTKVINGNLMNVVQFHALKSMLPYSIFGRYNAYLVYQQSVDGSAISTFVTKCRGAKMSIMVIKTETKTIGAVMTEELSLGYHGRYSNSNTYVFDLTQSVVYKKTANNNYCVSLERDSLTVGGGDLGCAIYIDEYFTNCSSYPCSTFNSPPLLSPNTKEEIQDIEVYKLSV